MDESFDTMLDEEMARAQDLPTSGMEEFDFIRQFAGDHVPEHLMRNRVFISLLLTHSLTHLLTHSLTVLSSSFNTHAFTHSTGGIRS